MSTTVRSYNKNNGVTYIYEVTGYKYDPKRKRTVPVRHLIGKEDPVTGEVIPTKGRGRPRKNPPSEPAAPTEQTLFASLESESSSLDLPVENSSVQDLPAEISQLQFQYDQARIEIALKNKRISQLGSALQYALTKIQSLSASYSGLEDAAQRIEEALKGNQ